jgi:hypothetical protein
MTTFAASVTIVYLPVGTTVTGIELLASDKPDLGSGMRDGPRNIDGRV